MTRHGFRIAALSIAILAGLALSPAQADDGCAFKTAYLTYTAAEQS